MNAERRLKILALEAQIALLHKEQQEEQAFLDEEAARLRREQERTMLASAPPLAYIATLSRVDESPLTDVEIQSIFDAAIDGGAGVLISVIRTGPGRYNVQRPGVLVIR